MRLLKKQTQTEVGQAIGVKKAMVSAVESGRATFHQEKLVKLAQYWGVSTGVLTSDYDYSNEDLEMLLNLENLIRRNPQSKHRQSIRSLLNNSQRE